MAGGGFGLGNLPFGVGVPPGAQQPRVVVAYGERAVDLWAAWRAGILAGHDEELFAAASLNPLAAAGRPTWQAVRGAVGEALRRPQPLPEGVLVPRAGLEMRLPVQVGDYVDGFGGLHHATNAGRLLRPGAEEPLAPNWRHMPVAYHGRAGTVVASGTPVRRPLGQVLVDGRPALAPTACLDVELEVGFVVGPGTAPGRPLPIEEAAEHIFGLVLVNDWSARDVQALESRPLGPYLGKSFATSISVWVVTLEALRPYLVPGLAGAQHPEPPAYLRTEDPWVPDLHLEIALQTPAMARAGAAPVTVSRVEYAEAMYWSMAQQLAHATVNGASVRPGDLFASGTASGPDPATAGGSLLELTWGGTRPLELPGGERRTFLEDGDTVVLRGWCGGGSAGQVLSMGEVVASVAPAPDLPAGGNGPGGWRGGGPPAPRPA